MVSNVACSDKRTFNGNESYTCLPNLNRAKLQLMPMILWLQPKKKKREKVREKKTIGGGVKYMILQIMLRFNYILCRLMIE